MAGVGNRLEEGYIRRPNDGNVLAQGCGWKKYITSQINEIKASD